MFDAIDPPERPLSTAHIALGALIAALALALGYAALRLPADPAPLAGAVAARLEASGLGNPVNAVLLNFRAVDTLLETGVLILALAGALVLSTDAGWGRPPANFATRHPVEPPLVLLVKVLVPLVAVAAIHLLFVGSDEPGGAFQAGTVLAAIAILLVLARILPPPGPAHPALRWAVVAGFVVFALAGFGTVALGRGFLDLPEHAAKAAILAIELVLALSVAATLMLLAGGLPEEPAHEDPA